VTTTSSPAFRSIPNVSVSIDSEAFRVIAAAEQIGRIRHDVLVVAPRREDQGPHLRDWWVRTWDETYEEVTIADLASADELAEVVHDAGAQLGATMLLTGSVRKAGDRVRIAARLVEAASGYLLWSGTYDRRVEDLFAIQETIARSIVDTLTERLQLSGTAGSRPQPASHEAYNLYLKGRYFWNQRTRSGLLKGIECFEAAIAIDPASALAQAGLADAYCLLVDYGLMAPAKGMPRAREAALRALDADPRSADATSLNTPIVNRPVSTSAIPTSSPNRSSSFPACDRCCDSLV